eukprot:5043542-Prymnesium_polylepis.2
MVSASAPAHAALAKVSARQWRAESGTTAMSQVDQRTFSGATEAVKRIAPGPSEFYPSGRPQDGAEATPGRRGALGGCD